MVQVMENNQIKEFFKSSLSGNIIMFVKPNYFSACVSLSPGSKVDSSLFILKVDDAYLATGLMSRSSSPTH